MIRKRIRASPLPPSPGENQLELGYLDIPELESARQPKTRLTIRRRGKETLVSREDGRPMALISENLQSFPITDVQPTNSPVMNLTEGQLQIRDETSRIADGVKLVVTQIRAAVYN